MTTRQHARMKHTAIREQQQSHAKLKELRERRRSYTLNESLETDEEPVPSTIAPRFSIILCTYNRCNLVLSTLASLRRQTLPYEQFEVIVVDNGSIDGTIAKVQAYVHAGPEQQKRPEDVWRVSCISEPRNGLAYARNTGMQAITGEIAVFLDDDTLVDPYFLERLSDSYQATGADAVGGRVVLRWEAPRPHWLTDDMLDILGYFAPANTRIPLPESLSFSSCSFSVKTEVLRTLGAFSPFLSKRLHTPTSIEIDNLCRRLRREDYALWYEPAAVVTHRVPVARLQRPFFVGRAYWQGRSEALMQYADLQADALQRKELSSAYPGTQLRAILLKVTLLELRVIIYLALLHRPLLFLAHKTANERLQAAMGQAHHWGHLLQQWQCIQHAPPDMTTPAVLLVASSELDASATLLARGLQSQGLPCTRTNTELPLSWLWRYRAYNGQSIGLVHFYRPGAFHLSHQQQRHLWFSIWLAHRLGIRIVTTDAGGWWQNIRSLRFLARRIFERRIIQCSDIVLSYTRQPEQLYRDKKLRRRLHCLPHPGFRGYYPTPLPRDQAHRQLGLPRRAGFVYLCLAHMHTEHELVHLIDAFSELCQGKQRKDKAEPQLVIIGSPRDKKVPTHLLERAAQNPALHLCMEEPQAQNIPLYMGASDAIVLPHFALQSAGVLDTAMLALSCERIVIAPNLPRFCGMLPPRASLLYDPSSRASLAQALYKAQTLKYHLKAKELVELEAERGWNQYASRLLDIYKQLLSC